MRLSIVLNCTVSVTENTGKNKARFDLVKFPQKVKDFIRKRGYIVVQSNDHKQQKLRKMSLIPPVHTRLFAHQNILSGLAPAENYGIFLVMHFVSKQRTKVDFACIVKVNH